MAFTVEARNFGKLTGGPITVGGLTVLAGPNATGKSFFSKALYSILNAAGENHVSLGIRVRIARLKIQLDWLTKEAMDEESQQLLSKHPAMDKFHEELEQLANVCEQVSADKDECEATSKANAKLAEHARAVVESYRELRPTLKSKARDTKECLADTALSTVDSHIEPINLVAQGDQKSFSALGLSRAIKNELHGNFVASRVSELRAAPDREMLFKIPGKIEVSIQENHHMVTKASAQDLEWLRQHSKVIYLESPAYWRLQGPLRTMAFQKATDLPELNKLVRLGVPKYFYDLNAKLELERLGETPFRAVFDRLTGTDVMGGKVVRNEVGRLHFHETATSRTFSLHMTATGSVNLGILALLIEKNIIDKGSFLFIDEPETNLHPKWHAVIASALLDLAKGGVHVVIATHSADILQRLFGLVRKDPKVEKLVALNHFSQNGIVGADQSFEKKIHRILEELTDDYSDSYMMTQGLGDV